MDFRVLEDGEREEAIKELRAAAPDLKDLPFSQSINKQCSDYSQDLLTGRYGLFINLKTFSSVSLEALPVDSLLSGCRVYVHLSSGVHVSNALAALKKRAERQAGETAANLEETGDTAKPTKMAIGVEGGFSGEGDLLDPAGSFAALEATVSYRLCVFCPKVSPEGSAVLSKLSDLYRGSLECLRDYYQPQEMEKDKDKTFLNIFQRLQRELAMQCLFLSLKDPDVPPAIAQAANRVVTHKFSIAPAAPSAAWVEEILPSKYADNLPVVENPPRISPNNWKCNECGATNNLWLNLSDGFIGCGRKLYGAGGGCADGKEGAALRHYEQTGCRFPLIVKLGTITKDTADVFSYAKDENDSVTDPKLPEHLARFGIELQQLEKTEKSTNELAIDINSKFDWNSLADAAAEQQQQQGLNKVGLRNLGNTCYANAVLQALFSIPRFLNRFSYLYGPILCCRGLAANAAAAAAGEMQPSKCLSLQLAALSIALGTKRTRLQRTLLLQELEDHLAKQQQEVDEAQLLNDLPYLAHDSVSPLSLRSIFGSLHAEFATSRQQDAEEFLSLFLSWVGEREEKERRQLETLKRVLRRGKSCAAGSVSRLLGLTEKNIKQAEDALQKGTVDSLFSFAVEQRLQCLQSNKFRYTYSRQQVLALPIPVHVQQQEQQQQQQQEQQQKRRKAASEMLSEPEAAIDVDGDAAAGTGKEAEEAPCQPPSVSFASCVSAAAAAAAVSDYLSPATNKRGEAEKTIRLASFPNYLLVFLKRFYVNDSWIPQKLKCSVQIPEEVSFEELRAFGAQPGEEELPEEQKGNAAAETEMLGTLEAMGFTTNAVKKAIAATGGSSAEECVDWLMNHLDDPSLNDPSPDGAATGDAAEAAAAAEATAVDEAEATTAAILSERGLTEETVRCGCFVQRSRMGTAAWLRQSPLETAEFVAHWAEFEGGRSPDVVNEILEQMEQQQQEEQQRREKERHLALLSPLERQKDGLSDGTTKYKLAAFVTHLGSNVSGGHYVCHVRDEETAGDNWIEFNDEKVRRVKNPKSDQAYILLFKRN